MTNNGVRDGRKNDAKNQLIGMFPNRVFLGWLFWVDLVRVQGELGVSHQEDRRDLVL